MINCIHCPVCGRGNTLPDQRQVNGNSYTQQFICKCDELVKLGVVMEDGVVKVSVEGHGQVPF